MKARSRFLASVDKRLQQRGLRTAWRIGLPGLPTADLEARFDARFRYAKQVNRVPLLRGMQFGYLIIPCLVVNEADATLVSAAGRRPHKPWSLFELPVVVDLRTTSAYYSRLP